MEARTAVRAWVVGRVPVLVQEVRGEVVEVMVLGVRGVWGACCPWVTPAPDREVGAVCDGGGKPGAALLALVVAVVVVVEAPEVDDPVPVVAVLSVLVDAPEVDAGTDTCCPV